MTPYHFFYVYVLQSLAMPAQWYVGYSANLRKRLTEHNEGLVTSTKRYLPWQLRYYEGFSEEHAARKREISLKQNGNPMRELKKRIGAADSVKSGKGFTLVETLIAIAIISIAIVGPFHVAQGVLQTSYTARDQLLASSLAQEGVEYIRSVRDGNYLFNLHNSGSRPWLFGFDASTYGGVQSADCYSNACVVDVGQQSPIATSCGDATCATRPLYLSASNIYTQTVTIKPTKFVRKVVFTSISATETLVTVTVTWTSHGTHTLILTETLRNWL